MWHLPSGCLVLWIAYETNRNKHLSPGQMGNWWSCWTYTLFDHLRRSYFSVTVMDFFIVDGLKNKSKRIAWKSRTFALYIYIYGYYMLWLSSLKLTLRTGKWMVEQDDRFLLGFGLGAIPLISIRKGFQHLKSFHDSKSQTTTVWMYKTL